jgi:Photosynthetic reaction centre cytochrome C subunit
MRPSPGIFRGAAMLVLATCSLVSACHRTVPPATPAPAAAPAPDTVAAFNARMVAGVLERIRGREDLPADSVFRNLRILGDVPARTFLAIMNIGYARALGVRCTHCHVMGNFASDAKRPKRAAREMAAMHRMINGELAKMDELATPKTENRAINCATCHRGAVIPQER